MVFFYDNTLSKYNIIVTIFRFWINNSTQALIILVFLYFLIFIFFGLICYKLFVLIFPTKKTFTNIKFSKYNTTIPLWSIRQLKILKYIWQDVYMMLNNRLLVLITFLDAYLMVHHVWSLVAFCKNIIYFSSFKIYPFT